MCVNQGVNRDIGEGEDYATLLSGDGKQGTNQIEEKEHDQVQEECVKGVKQVFVKEWPDRDGLRKVYYNWGVVRGGGDPGQPKKKETHKSKLKKGIKSGNFHQNKVDVPVAVQTDIYKEVVIEQQEHSIMSSTLDYFWKATSFIL